MPNVILQEVNFSGETQPALILALLQRHCDYTETIHGVTMQPRDPAKSLVLFCDELNLPQPDKYGTQAAVTFLWQLVEAKGFWHPTTAKWVALQRIQFVGACNPPTDAGRFLLPERFLRHSAILYIDYPSRVGLGQIYHTFTSAILKTSATLAPYAETVANIMIDYYYLCKEKFTAAMQQHYIYSPRELTRWVRSLNRTLHRRLAEFSLDGLVRLMLHDGLRLFQDRLVTPAEQQWASDALDVTIMKRIPHTERAALARPVLFSDRLTNFFSSVSQDDIRAYFANQIPLFQAQEGNIPIVLFDEALDHILRIDAVFKQTQGHMALIGGSGSGKVLLSRFVAFCNKLSIFRIKVNQRYTAAQFDEDLQGLLKRVGCEGERICFIFDESNVMESGFLEKMNTLLASGDIPGIFTGEALTALLQSVKQQAHYKNIALATEDEIYNYFTQRVRENLHVIFTLNPASAEYHNRSATSPALFNRCVLDWFGEWSPASLFAVGMEIVQLPPEVYETTKYKSPFKAPIEIKSFCSYPMTYKEAVVGALVMAHRSMDAINAEVRSAQGRYNYVTPRHFLDVLAHLAKLIIKKRQLFLDQQAHLKIGLLKLEETQAEVKELQAILEDKSEKLAVIRTELDSKLERLVTDKQATEAQRISVGDMKDHLERQTLEIKTDRDFAEAELAVAQPALEDAKKAVTGIRQH
jgi:dynein heavy chain 1